MIPQTRSLACAVLAFCAVAAQAQQSGMNAAQQQRATADTGQQAQPRVNRQMPAADRRFMTRAAEAGHAEVAAGRLAISHGSDAAVRDYGRMLVDDHQRANAQLVQIANARGLGLPTEPSREQQQKLQKLGRLQGQAFDREFMQQMIADHGKAIALFREEAQRQGGEPAVQNYAREVLPTLHTHLDRAQGTHARLQAAAASTAAAGEASRSRQGGASEHADARQKVQGAVQVVQKMKSDPRLTQLLERAHGVFIVPNYGRGALGIGAQGGEGLLVTRNGEQFGSPAFYNMGGVSIGAQVGAAAGEVAFLLMTERAVQQFRSDRKFSLNADAGLTIGNYSARAQTSAGKVQDVVVWSDTEGAYAGVSAGVTDILPDNEANRAYYGRSDATPLTILSGRMEDPYGNALGSVLGA